MEVSKEEILHIAKLANISIKDEEINEYILNLQDILNFANIINSVNTDGMDEALGGIETFNVFREDEIKDFKDKNLLLQNAPSQEDNMFNIPKVI